MTGIRSERAHIHKHTQKMNGTMSYSNQWKLVCAQRPTKRVFCYLSIAAASHISVILIERVSLRTEIGYSTSTTPINRKKKIRMQNPLPFSVDFY